MVSGRGREGQRRLFVDRLIADRGQHGCHVDFGDRDRDRLEIGQVGSIEAIVGDGDGGVERHAALRLGRRKAEFSRVGIDAHPRRDRCRVEAECQVLHRVVLVRRHGREGQRRLFVDRPIANRSQHRRIVPTVDGQVHSGCVRAALPIGNAVGKTVHPRHARYQRIENAVGIVGERAGGVDGQQRARCQGKLLVDVGAAPVHFDHAERVAGIGIAVGGRRIGCQQIAADRRVFVGGDGIVDGNRADVRVSKRSRELRGVAPLVRGGGSDEFTNAEINVEHRHESDIACGICRHARLADEGLPFTKAGGIAGSVPKELERKLSAGRAVEQAIDRGQSAIHRECRDDREILLVVCASVAVAGIVERNAVIVQVDAKIAVRMNRVPLDVVAGRCCGVHLDTVCSVERDQI